MASAHPKPMVFVTDRRLARMVEPIGNMFRWHYRQDDGPLCHAGAVQAILCVGGDRVDAAMMAQFPNLRLIVCPSTGIDGIDSASAHANGIAVTSGAGINARETAAHAVALTLAGRHQLIAGDQLVRSGRWHRELPPHRRSMTDARIGIVGLGRIGQLYATTMATMSAAIGWHGPNPKDVAWRRFDRLLALAEWSDILLLSARSSPENRNLIDLAVLDALGPGGLLVNVARGFMIDERTLIDALRAGRLGAAALDVFESEPTDPTSWVNVPNLTLSPHVGGSSTRSVAALAKLVCENLLSLLTGGQPSNIVTPPGLGQTRIANSNGREADEAT